MTIVIFAFAFAFTFPLPFPLPMRLGAAVSSSDEMSMTPVGYVHNSWSLYQEYRLYVHTGFKKFMILLCTFPIALLTRFYLSNRQIRTTEIDGAYVHLFCLRWGSLVRVDSRNLFPCEKSVPELALWSSQYTHRNTVMLRIQVHYIAGMRRPRMRASGSGVFL